MSYYTALEDLFEDVVGKALRGQGLSQRDVEQRSGLKAGDLARRGRRDRLRGGLQGGPAEPVAAGLRPHHGAVRPARGKLRLGHTAVQHDQLDGAAHLEHPAVIRPVRAGDHLRAHPGQDVGGAAQGKVGRGPACAGV